MDFKLTTPVAMIIFNRPDVTFKVFERIRRAKPSKFFIIADGPREGRAGETEKCALARTIKDKVDWDCEVHTNFAEKNMGCKNRVYSGISWLFENVEESIILEDDCLPSMSFFRFCQELLEKYRYDTRVTVISGRNPEWNEDFEGSYKFKSWPSTWGWATWKRSWDLMDIKMTHWLKIKKSGYLKKIFPPKSYVHGSNEYTSTYEGKINTWDYQFQLSNILNHTLCVIPKKNMVRNIGHGHPDATHTGDPLNKAKFYIEEEIEFPLVHPKIMIPYDDITVETQPRLADEELIQEFQERDGNFKRLINAGDYDGVLSYFKDTLRNVERLQPPYIYYLSFACLMKGDYEHATDFSEDLLRMGVMPQSFIIFAQVFFNRKHFDECFEMWDKILARMPNIDDNLRNEIIREVQFGVENFFKEKYPHVAKLLPPTQRND